jgi:hypothetical protein
VNAKGYDDAPGLSERVATAGRASGPPDYACPDRHARLDVIDRPVLLPGEAPSLGRILFHLVQEYARHVGHLDIARELIDGQTGE